MHTTYYSVTAVFFFRSSNLSPLSFWISLLDVYYERESPYTYLFSRYLHVHDPCHHQTYLLHDPIECDTLHTQSYDDPCVWNKMIVLCLYHSQRTL
jgi:hypothetical protein